MTDTPMRRAPTQKRSRERVDAILANATEMIAQTGSDALRMSELAQRTGISIGSLYQYFPGKDAILAALIRQEAEAFDAALAQAVGRTGELGTSSAVALLAQVTVAHQASRPRLSRILDLEEQRLGLAGEADAAGARTVATIARFLADRKLGGEEAAFDILHLSRGLIDGALERGATHGLEQRLAWAILGYLALSRQSPTA